VRFKCNLRHYTVPVLAANVVPGATSPLVGKIAKSTVITKGGEKIGIVGINVKKKTEQSSFPSPGTTLTEEAAAAQAEIDALVALSVDKIILLTHIGYAADLAKLAGLKNVNVIVGGDQHALLAANASDVSGVGTVSGAYPTEKTNGSGKKVCVVQAWEYGKALGGLQVTFDANGDVTACSGKPHFVYDESSLATDAGVALNATARAAMKSYLDALGNFHAKAPHAATNTSLAAFAGQVASLKATKIATAPAVICMERVPGQGRSTLCTAAASAERGGGVGQLVAKVGDS
jgi:5'-nucleotidase/UDP-sugar diphosphatase